MSERADLRREPDPLGLAARQGLRGAVDRQVVETDVDEESEAGADLLEELVPDRAFPLGETDGQRCHPFDRVRDRQRRDIPDVAAVDGDGECLGPEPSAADTSGTGG